ncbi:MAG: hypothetical protein GX748_01715 [Lentisphaerae bacterium]|nr:hypothetical protein [Lentisphaerota bacterium]
MEATEYRSAGRGHKVGHVTIGKLLEKLGFTIQFNKKSHEGGAHPDRDGQFAHIARTAQAFMEMGRPRYPRTGRDALSRP